jgi:hypothetical protein
LSFNQNLADCWWQIPPFGKDFHRDLPLKIDIFPEISDFPECGTALV